MTEPTHLPVASTRDLDLVPPAVRPAWIAPEVEIIDIRETRTVGLGNNDGFISHT